MSLEPIKNAKKTGGHHFELHDRHHSHHDYERSPSINCATQHTVGSHDARTTRTCPVDAQRGRPPSSARRFGSNSPFDRPQEPDTKEGTGDSAGCPAKEDIWWLEGPGQDFPEPLWTPWSGLEERAEVRRLAQDEGDSAQGPRMGVYGQVTGYG
jgi:hypothetical protein